MQQYVQVHDADIDIWQVNHTLFYMQYDALVSKMDRITKVLNMCLYGIKSNYSSFFDIQKELNLCLATFFSQVMQQQWSGISNSHFDKQL